MFGACIHCKYALVAAIQRQPVLSSQLCSATSRTVLDDARARKSNLYYRPSSGGIAMYSQNTISNNNDIRFRFAAVQRVSDGRIELDYSSNQVIEPSDTALD